MDPGVTIERETGILYTQTFRKLPMQAPRIKIIAIIIPVNMIPVIAF